MLECTKEKLIFDMRERGEWAVNGDYYDIGQSGSMMGMFVPHTGEYRKCSVCAGPLIKGDVTILDFFEAPRIVNLLHDRCNIS